VCQASNQGNNQTTNMHADYRGGQASNWFGDHLDASPASRIADHATKKYAGEGNQLNIFSSEANTRQQRFSTNITGGSKQHAAPPTVQYRAPSFNRNITGQSKQHHQRTVQQSDIGFSGGEQSGYNTKSSTDVLAAREQEEQRARQQRQQQEAVGLTTAYINRNKKENTSLW
jgi:hypothetical protein